MDIDLQLHAAITDLPEGLEIVYGEGQEPEWTKTAEAKQAADEYCNRTGATPGKVWGAQLHLQLNGDNPKLFVNLYPGTFGHTKLESLGHADWRFERVNCPSITKVRIPNPRNLRGVDNIIDMSDGAEDCVLMGLYEGGNGVNPSQLIVCTGGVWNDDIIASENPAEANLRERQKKNLGLDIDEATYRPSCLIADGSMRHLMWEVDYGTRSAEWLIENFTSDIFTDLMVIRDHPEAIDLAGREFRHTHKLWKWAVPLSQRAHGLVA